MAKEKIASVVDLGESTKRIFVVGTKFGQDEDVIEIHLKGEIINVSAK